MLLHPHPQQHETHRRLGDLICKEVPVAKVLEELPDHLDPALKMRMAQSSYKKVCAKHPGRTL